MSDHDPSIETPPEFWLSAFSCPEGPMILHIRGPLSAEYTTQLLQRVAVGAQIVVEREPNAERYHARTCDFAEHFPGPIEIDNGEGHDFLSNVLGNGRRAT